MGGSAPGQGKGAALCRTSCMRTPSQPRTQHIRLLGRIYGVQPMTVRPQWHQVLRYVAGRSETLPEIRRNISSRCAGHMGASAICNMVLDVAGRRSFAARDGEPQHVLLALLSCMHARCVPE